MPSNPNKAEEIWEGRSHSALDRGDIRRMLLAILIIGTFACLEVGIFLFTLEEKPGGISSRPGQDNRPSQNPGHRFHGGGAASPSGRKTRKRLCSDLDEITGPASAFTADFDTLANGGGRAVGLSG
jgi:hypothetical protein